MRCADHLQHAALLEFDTASPNEVSTMTADPEPSRPVELSLPRPEVAAADAQRLLREHWGIEAERLDELGSQQDRNLRVDSPAGRFVLKLGNPVIGRAPLERQNAALGRLASMAGHGIRVPGVVAARDGREIVEAEVRGAVLPVRLLHWVEGRPLAGQPVGAALAAELGRTAARVAETLAGSPVSDPSPATPWDLRLAERLVDELAPSIRDDAERERVHAATRAALDRLTPVAPLLPLQLIHGDVTDDNVVTDPADPGRIAGVIDFGDLAPGWRVAELAVGVASLLHHLPARPLAVLHQIRAFDGIVPLDDAELRALWPLVVLRGAMLVAAGRHQVAIDGDNDYASDRLEREWLAFATAAEIGFDEAELAIRGALRPPAPLPAPTHPILAGAPAAELVELSVYAPAMDEGGWLDPETEGRALHAARAGGRIAATRYAEARASRAELLAPVPPRSVALAVELLLPGGTELHAPVAGELREEGETLVLSADGVELRMGGVDAVRTGTVAAGEVAARARDAETPVAVTLCRVPGLVPPPFVRAGDDESWAAVCPDPTPWLGLGETRRPDHVPAGTDVAAGTLLERREAVFARVHERYFTAPPRIERGWMHHLLDEHGRSYLDMLNNVAAVGHAHPRVVAAATAQWRRLNTNSRFLYGELVRYSERLAALAPEGLDTVFLVNSGTEAVDLALRLVQAATGRRTVVALREAYHGWSMASDAVSSSLNDNPHALGTRPGWVRLADAPNPIRGRHRGMDSAPAYLADLEELLDTANAEGSPPAGFIGEAVFGNGGGVLLPDGYLAGAYDAIRRRGGLCIADEIQVGLGRLGEHFWAFEQQGAVPDVITVAKSVGDGQPLGAVICRREIAEAYRAEGSFFSSAGGSPVSCAVGNAVLDVLEEEGLVERARVVGGRLRDELRALGGRHPSVGAVHGMGFYLGVELVADRETMQPDGELAASVCEELLEAGVIVLPTGDGKNVLKIKPPMTIGDAEVDYFVARLDRALTRVGERRAG